MTPREIACVLCFFVAGMVGVGAAGFDPIEDYLREQQTRSGIPGLAYAIVNDGRVVRTGSVGRADSSGSPMSLTDPVVLGSVSKTFTALAVRQLVNEGSIDLDESAALYLGPGFSPRVTIRHLLEHRSGYGTRDGNAPELFDSRVSTDEVIAGIIDLPLRHSPGEMYEYSNINYILLGRLVEIVSGLPLEEYLQQRVFVPLDMGDTRALAAPAQTTGYRFFYGFPREVAIPIPAAGSGAGFILSTTQDMTHYLIALTGGGWYGTTWLPNPNANVPAGESEAGFTPYWEDRSSLAGRGNTETYRGGWLNSSAGIAYMPEERIGIVVLANAFPAQWLPVKDAGAIAFDLLRIYTGNPPTPAGARLALRYGLADLLLGAAALFVMWRGYLLFLPASRQARGAANGLILDVAVPLAVLFAFPALFQGRAPGGNLPGDWSRLFFQVPDVGWFVFCAAFVLLAIGMVRTGSLILSTRRRG